eukprot:2113692-Amphidinium_carterae.2
MAPITNLSPQKGGRCALLLVTFGYWPLMQAWSRAALRHLCMHVCVYGHQSKRISHKEELRNQSNFEDVTTIRSHLRARMGPPSSRFTECIVDRIEVTAFVQNPPRSTIDVPNF